MARIAFAIMRGEAPYRAIWADRALAGFAARLKSQGSIGVEGDQAVMRRKRIDPEARARTPVVPEAATVRTLSDQIRHPRPRSAMSDSRVRRAKAALSSGCKPHPATAPAGSNRSSHGGAVSRGNVLLFCGGRKSCQFARTSWWWTQSRQTGLPGRFSLSTGKKQGNFIKSGSCRLSLTIICAQFHDVTSKFPVNWNRE